VILIPRKARLAITRPVLLPLSGSAFISAALPATLRRTVLYLPFPHYGDYVVHRFLATTSFVVSCHPVGLLRVATPAYLYPNTAS
jgi:hypothetical protein